MFKHILAFFALIVAASSVLGQLFIYFDSGELEPLVDFATACLGILLALIWYARRRYADFWWTFAVTTGLIATPIFLTYSAVYLYYGELSADLIAGFFGRSLGFALILGLPIAFGLTTFWGRNPLPGE